MRSFSTPESPSSDAPAEARSPPASRRKGAMPGRSLPGGNGSASAAPRPKDRSRRDSRNPPVAKVLRTRAAVRPPRAAARYSPGISPGSPPALRPADRASIHLPHRRSALQGGEASQGLNAFRDSQRLQSNLPSAFFRQRSRRAYDRKPPNAA